MAGPEADPDRTDALLTEWESLQRGIHEYKRQSHRRIISGGLVLAAVAGYAVQAPALWLLAFIPLIVALLFFVHVQESNHVYYRSWQCDRIERAVDIERFDWTGEFGGLTRPNTGYPVGKTRWHLSWRLSPSTAIYGVGVIVYVTFAVYSALAVFPDNVGELVGGPAAAVAFGAGVYVVLTAVMVLVGYTHWHIRLRYGEEIESGPSG